MSQLLGVSYLASVVGAAVLRGLVVGNGGAWGVWCLPRVCVRARVFRLEEGQAWCVF